MKDVPWEKDLKSNMGVSASQCDRALTMSLEREEKVRRDHNGLLLYSVIHLCVCVCVCVCARTLAVCSSKIFHYGRVLLNVCVCFHLSVLDRCVSGSHCHLSLPLFHFFCCAAGLQFDFLGSASPIQTMSGCHYVGIFFFFNFFLPVSACGHSAPYSHNGCSAVSGCCT